MADQTASGQKKLINKELLLPAAIVAAVIAVGLILAFVLFKNNSNNKSEPSKPLTGTYRPKVHASSNVGQVSGANGLYIGQSASDQSYSTNSNFTVYLRENSGSAPVNAVQINLSYPGDNLQVVKIDATDSNFTVQAQNQAMDGKITLARGSLTPLTGDQLVAAVTFKAASAGTLSLDFTSGTAVINSSTNQPIGSGLPAPVTFEIK